MQLCCFGKKLNAPALTAYTEPSWKESKFFAAKSVCEPAMKAAADSAMIPASAFPAKPKHWILKNTTKKIILCK